MARGAAKRGKRIAFGDGIKIKWDANSRMVFANNPNIAVPGSERHSSRIEWIAFYRGNRIYNRQDGDKWIWNYDFRPTPGEMFFSRSEGRFADGVGKGFIVIEPNVPAHKTVAPNKQWPVERYDEIARQLLEQGYDVAQFVYGSGHRIPAARKITTPTFRTALAALAKAQLYIGPEGGLHHGAAAVNVPAVVLFGGFIPPQVTGYPTHTNLTGGAEACGNFMPCEHCRDAMARISCDEVLEACRPYLSPAAQATSAPTSASGSLAKAGSL